MKINVCPPSNPAQRNPAQRKLCGISLSGARLPVSKITLSVVVLLHLHGCATLPDARQNRAEPHSRQVAFHGVHGAVSAARSDAIVARLATTKSDVDVLKKHLAYEQAVNIDSPLIIGNKVTLLQNGPATYTAMFAAIRSAKDHINLETYIFDDGEAGKQFSDLLLERQAAGVQVNIIYDSVGSLLTAPDFHKRLREGGIRLLEFNPVNPLAGNKRGWLLNNRDHRRQLLIDGRIAFTGGVNISDTYSSAPSGKHTRKKRAQAVAKVAGWRDTHIQLQGPVVAEFQKLFMATWARQKGDPLTPRNYYPTLATQGNDIVRAIGSMPTDPKSPIYLTLMSAITHAEKEIHLTIAYFAPDPQLLKALTDAAQRGVDVRLVLPGNTDSWPIFNLGRSYYSKLLRGGVRIYERRGSVMHAKTACIDGVWSTVGSTNMDSRSFLHNDELNAVILGREFAAQMESVFADDIAESDEIRLEHWKHRPVMMRIKEQVARIGAYWL